MTMTREEKVDRISGAFFGTAIGDALGAPVESWTPHEISAKLGCVTGYLDSTEGMNAHKLKRGEWTDDTLMALALARGLIKATASDPNTREIVWQADWREKLVHLVVEEHLADWKTNPKNSCYGKATREALQALKRGVPWRKSGSPKSPGNGVAMRIAPAGLWFSEIARQTSNVGDGDARLIAEDKDERCEAEQFFFNLMRLVHDLGFITHQGKNALSCGVLQAYLAHKFYRSELMISPKNWNELVWKELCRATELLVEVLDCGTELVAMLRSAKHKGKWRPYRDIIAGIGSGFTAIQSCALAWTAAIMHADDLKLGILAAVNSGGDADTVGAMAGALLGARHGFAKIQKTGWVEGLDKREEILETANLFALAILSGSITLGGETPTCHRGLTSLKGE